MARQHLAALKAAGVQWLPAAPASTPEPEIVPPPAVEESTPRTLFSAIEGDPADLDSRPASPLSLEQRCRALDVLGERVSQCTRCSQLVANRSRTVFGVGKVGADLCFIGEGPGADEDAQGEPFVGAAGQLLNKIIAACGMEREEVYICNIVKCRPPGNRTPLTDEAANCREYLEEQLALVRPRFICCLGACAAQNLLGTTLSIGKMRGKFYDYRGTPVACTYHPAYLLRNPSSKRDVWDDMKKLMARMGRPVK
jgi:DNA polymerase